MRMRAVQADRPGGPEVLGVREVAAPVAAAGQVLVRTVASSINPVDRSMRHDESRSFPQTLGWDVAGIVIDSNVLEFRPGDRVMGMSHVLRTGVGAWSDLVALDASCLAQAPTAVSLTEAATLPLAGLTALQSWNALTLTDVTRVLVTGAAGAIGGLAVQFARNAGIAVDGLVSRAEHVGPARSLGADFVTTEPAELPRGRYDAILDTVSLPARLDVRPLVTERGQYVAPGPAESHLARARRIRVVNDPEGLAQLAKIVDDGALGVRVAAHYPIREVHDAHRHFEAGGVLGKIVIVF